MLKLPESVQIIEVGLRDGLQNEAVIIPTCDKLRMIDRLIETGITEIQVTSFTHPTRIPQMADAEFLCQQLPVQEGVTFSGLVLNQRGLERAYHAGLSKVDIGISASNTHSLKNTGKGLSEKLDEFIAMVHQAKTWGLTVRAGLQCVFGCVYEGKIPLDKISGLIKTYSQLPVDEIALADSTGMGNPRQIQEFLHTLLPIIGGIPLILHLHDTYGLGLVNLLAALEMGVIRFDCAFGGMGGCPFIEGAAGNIATEDVVYMLDSMGIHTGIDWRKLTAISKNMEASVGHHLAGKLYQLT